MSFALSIIFGALAGGIGVHFTIRLVDGPESRGSAVCPSCHSSLSSVQRIPVFGWFAGCGRCRSCRKPLPVWYVLMPIGTAVLFGVYSQVVLDLGCQRIVEVQPDPFSHVARLGYHLLLFTALVTATATDLRDYMIPDAITAPATIAGILLATVSGDLQIIHLWVDWNHPLIELDGPWIPDWIQQHRHLHGFAWSVAGAAAGGGLTWMVRVSSRLILGHAAFGFGDVTLMTMIGSFVGWQAAVLVFLIAPLMAIGFGLAILVFTGRRIIPYGPWLAAATPVVLSLWRWIWVPLREVFGHLQSLLTMSGICVAAMILMLTALRFWRSPRSIGSNSGKST